MPAPGAAATAPAPAPAAAATIEKTFFVQVGAYSVADNAASVQEALERNGLPGVVIQTIERDGLPLHRVRVGPVTSVEQFDTLIARLGALGYGEARLAAD